MNRFLFFVLLVICYNPSRAQDVKNIFVDTSDNGKILSELLLSLEEKNHVDFLYDENQMRSLTAMRIQQKTRIVEFLDETLPNFNIVKVLDNVVVILNKETGGPTAWRKENYFILKRPVGSQTTLKGIVIDGKSSEPLVGAQIYLQELQKGTQTDAAGQFSIQNIPVAVQKVEIKHAGYDAGTYIVGFSPYGDSDRISPTIFPASKQLESVIITAEKIDANVTSQLTGVERLGIATIKAMPAFLGEVDPIRTLTTLPGVSTPGDLASGFNVRGGESGQNLILQDGATIYNPSHLFGFFSAFNPDLVRSVTLYKGGGPANFGSRISSVLEVSLKNGDAGKHIVTGGVGLISSRLAIEGPIVRNKSSYLVGGRISYCNWLVKSTDDIQLKNSGANFYDITAKIFHTFNENNFLTLSYYDSYDEFKFASDSTYSWGTRNFALKWDHTFNDRISSALNISNSNYFSALNSESLVDGFTYKNAITNVGLKYDITFSLGEDSKIIGGFESTCTIIEPGKRVPNEDAVNVTAENMSDQRTVESAVYIQGDFKILDKLSVSAGLRYSSFLRLGQDIMYTYDYSNMLGRYPDIVDTIAYSTGQIISRYSGLEPRLSMRYLLASDLSIKASYYRGYQYLHLISNTTTVTPQDYWIASGPYLKPQIGDQFSVGLFKNLKNNRYEFSMEGFYKEVDHAVDYIEGADLTLNPALDAGLSQGKGLAYGVEVLLKRNTGKLNGWLAYTYSRSLRKFNGESSIMINNGDYYAATFDQPNHVSLVLNYQISARASFSANFNYSTGRPITIPISKFSYDAYLSVLNYSKRNEYRIPDYHRLDVSLTIKDDPKKTRRVKSEWVISIFNVYGRKNTYSVSFDRYGMASKLSVLGTIFPSIGYNFKF